VHSEKRKQIKRRARKTGIIVKEVDDADRYSRLRIIGGAHVDLAHPAGRPGSTHPLAGNHDMPSAGRHVGNVAKRRGAKDTLGIKCGEVLTGRLLDKKKEPLLLLLADICERTK